VLCRSASEEGTCRARKKAGGIVEKDKELRPNTERALEERGKKKYKIPMEDISKWKNMREKKVPPKKTRPTPMKEKKKSSRRVPRRGALAQVSVREERGKPGGWN